MTIPVSIVLDHDGSVVLMASRKAVSLALNNGRQAMLSMYSLGTHRLGISKPAVRMDVPNTIVTSWMTWCPYLRIKMHEFDMPLGRTCSYRSLHYFFFVYRWDLCGEHTRRDGTTKKNALFTHIQ